MKFAYADPPYKGLAKKHYGAQAEEIDHMALVKKLVDNYDGWALSAHQTHLRELLSYCPKKTRIGIWVKPFASFKKNVNPTYAWEPLLFHAPSRGSKRKFVHDWVACCPQMKALVVGQKPLDFCFWMFQMLGLTPQDGFDDLFPGSGNVNYAHEQYIKHFNDVEFFKLTRSEGSVRDLRPVLQTRFETGYPPAEKK